MGSSDDGGALSEAYKGVDTSEWADWDGLD